MQYSGIIRCPNCKIESDKYNFKREWTSLNLFVNEVECNNCGFTYRIYFGSKKDGSPIVYTIPK